jgi:hypothetical protein
MQTPDKYTMCWQIALNSKYTDDYLLSLPIEELKQLWLEKVEKK